jgi:putative flippase GtrA
MPPPSAYFTGDYLASAALLWLLVEFGGLHGAIAKGLTLPLVVALQFTLNRRITFRPATA